MKARRAQRIDSNRRRRWTTAAVGAAACTVLIALAGCGSSDEPDGSSGDGKGGGSSAEGDPTAAKVAAATRGVRTVRFKGTSTTLGNRYKWRVTIDGRLDRERKRAAFLVPQSMRAGGPSAEYRVFGSTTYLRQLTPRRGAWVRQNLRTQGPGGLLSYPVATGRIFRLLRHLKDPLEEGSEGSVHGVPVTEYSAEVRESGDETAFNSRQPSTPIKVSLDDDNRVRRLSFGIGSTSGDPALGTIAERVSIEFWDINRPVEVARPR